MATADYKNSRELKITRLFDAPRTLVWKAWTDPALVKRWWGPEYFTAPAITVDLRPGGRYLYCMRSPDGKDFWSTGVFREVQAPGRLVVSDSFADDQGRVVPASYYGMSGEWPMELEIVVTFEEQGGKTEFTLTYDNFPAGEMFDNARTGWSQSFDKLALVLEEEVERRAKTRIIAEPGKQEASMVRVFNAPPEIVFGALTDPKLLVRWWAPRRFATIVDWLDVRPGGSWRILNRDTGGNEFAFHGVYHEVSPMRIVGTFEFEGRPGHVILTLQTLEYMDGKTKLTSKSIFESVEDRDGMMQAGMEDGGPETMDQLAELVEKPQKA
jgi:uncharacterized protein YndB with AHSA1/START domain